MCVLAKEIREQKNFEVDDSSSCCWTNDAGAWQNIYGTKITDNSSLLLYNC